MIPQAAHSRQSALCLAHAKCSLALEMLPIIVAFIHYSCQLGLLKCGALVGGRGPIHIQIHPCFLTGPGPLLGTCPFQSPSACNSGRHLRYYRWLRDTGTCGRQHPAGWKAGARQPGGADTGESPASPAASTQLLAYLGISRSTLTEHKPDAWPWGYGRDADRQRPPCFILSTSASQFQKGRRPRSGSTDRRIEHFEVMIHAGKGQHWSWPGWALVSERRPAG